MAVGDVNGDGIADIAVGLNQGGPLVRVYRGGDFAKLTGFRAGSGIDFIGGTNVAIGEMTGDGKADVVVSATYAGRSVVRGYSGASLAPGVVPQRAFTGSSLGGPYVSGLFLAVGDVNNDSRADLIIGTAATRNPNVKVFSGDALVDDNIRSKIASFSPAGRAQDGNPGRRAGHQRRRGTRHHHFVWRTGHGVPGRESAGDGSAAAIVRVRPEPRCQRRCLGWIRVTRWPAALRVDRFDSAGAARNAPAAISQLRSLALGDCRGIIPKP